MKRATGRIFWDDAEYVSRLSDIPHIGAEKALFRLTKQLPELVWNAAALEGNTFTMPEVKTLLDGTTIGGKRLEEEKQILNLSAAFNELHQLVKAGEFKLSMETSNRLHRIVAIDEALNAGMVRGQGNVHGDGGGVRLLNGGFVEIDPESHLVQDFVDLTDIIRTIEHPVEAALAYFCSATRSQFYFDGNKRTARLVASGMLMSAGYEALNIPHARRLEFNIALDALFSTDDASALMLFLVEVLLDSQR